MNEQIKIGLLAIIAGTLVVNTVMISGGTGTADEAEENVPYDPLKSETSAATTTPANNTNSTAASAFNTDPVDNTPKTSIEFAESLWDYGTVPQDSKNEHIFKFTNTGSEPLIISNATGSCGCTVPEYPKEPIAPGGVGEIKVVYSPGKQKDNQTKTVSVTANTEPAVTQVTIKAFVEHDGHDDEEKGS